MWVEGRFYLDMKAFPWIEKSIKSVGIFLASQICKQVFHFPELDTLTGAITRRDVSLYYPDEEGEILLVQQGDVEGGLWNIVAGKSEINETPLRTALRECLEETGLELHPNSLNFMGASIRRAYFSAALPYRFDPSRLTPRNEITGYKMVNVERYYTCSSKQYGYNLPLYRPDIFGEQFYLLRDVYGMFGPS